ncbi:MAG: gamma-glutamyl-gamma-aminobutyrate hydrolase family protein [Chloroflexi bacterium]|nr:gamma-glutamyl-gamma-aminobutyrate hydrolase family protein [Chloroflexota bacterium]
MRFSTSRLPIIGVSTMDDHDAAGVHMDRFSNNQAYVKAVEAAGGVPILIPQLEDPAALRCIYEMLDGLMLPGGLDMHPRFYGQEPHPALDPSDLGLDHIETTMLPWALEDDMPVLGICRGEQVINVVMGGTLVQDIYTQYPTSIDHRESAKRKIRDYLAHDIVVDEGSRLRGIVGEDRVWVNTAHHQAIDRVAPGLVATAWAPDGIVEAVESPDRHYVVAVQCHPEILYRKHRWASRFFQSFVEAASERLQSSQRSAGATVHTGAPVAANRAASA